MGQSTLNMFKSLIYISSWSSENSYMFAYTATLLINKPEILQSVKSAERELYS